MTSDKSPTDETKEKCRQAIETLKDSEYPEEGFVGMFYGGSGLLDNISTEEKIAAIDWIYREYDVSDEGVMRAKQSAFAVEAPDAFADIGDIMIFDTFCSMLWEASGFQDYQIERDW